MSIGFQIFFWVKMTKKISLGRAFLANQQLLQAISPLRCEISIKSIWNPCVTNFRFANPTSSIVLDNVSNCAIRYWGHWSDDSCYAIFFNRGFYSTPDANTIVGARHSKTGAAILLLYRNPTQSHNSGLRVQLIVPRLWESRSCTACSCTGLRMTLKSCRERQ